MELPHRSGKPFTISDGNMGPAKRLPPTNYTESKEVLTEKSVRPPPISAHGPAVDHPTSFFETLTHLLRGNIGSGLMAMGDAFKNGGLIIATGLTLFLGVVCTHNQHILLKCAHRVKEIRGLDTEPDFAETVELCFEHGSPRFKHWAKASKLVVNIFLCITQLSFCCVYFVFASTSFKQIADFRGIELSVHWHMCIILLPVLIPALVPNLKHLAPVSTMANICMALGISVALYYMLNGPLPDITERKYVGDLYTLPLFFGTAIYAFEGIALVLPLKNAMREPKKFGTSFGVLNIGITIVTALLISVGFLAYWKWGDKVLGSVTLNLPQGELLAEVVKFSVGLSMCLTFALQFFIPIQIMWPSIQRKLGPFASPMFAEIVFRTAMVLVTFVIAQLVPHLHLIISLVGALCSTGLALFIPAVIQIVLGYGTEKGPSYTVLIKNTLIILLGIVGLVTGTVESVEALIRTIMGRNNAV